MAGWPVEEFDAFVASRLPALVRFGYALTGDLGHAEDLVQIALVKTYRATRRRTPRRAGGLRTSRDRHRQPVPVPPPPRRGGPRRCGAPSPVAAPAPAGEQRQALDALLAGLTPRQRTVMVLRYQQDWPEAEIAAAMGVSVGTVKTLASRALSTLRATVTTTERTGS